MLSRLAGPRGGNLALVAALAVLVILAVGIFLGPLQSHRAALAAELDAELERQESWAQDVERFESPTDAELARWGAHWNALLERVRPFDTDAQLTARLARDLEAPTLRRLEIRRMSTQGAEGERITLTSPVDGGQIALGTVPLRIDFVASFEDVTYLLGQIESRAIPARIQTLDLKRDFPDVHVQMDVDYFFRRDS